MAVTLAQPVMPRCRPGRSIPGLVRHNFNPYPKYLQVRRILLGRIGRRMRPGDQLPTEHALCAEFSVSRETIRAALAALEQDGIIQRTRGRGTFIAKLPSERGEQRLTGLAEDFSALNLDTEARILDGVIVPAPPEMAAAAAIEPGNPMFRLTRVRSFEGAPLAYYEAWMPPAIGRRVAQHDLRRTSIRRTLTDTLRVPCWEESQTIEAVAATPEIAGLLEIPPGSPLLCLTRLYLSGARELVVYFRSLYRADRYFYTAQLVQRPPAARQARPATRRPAKGARSSR